MTFKIKTYRCEWQVQFGEVDQYGMFKPYQTEVFETREKAERYRNAVCYKNPWNGLYIPPNAPNGYCECQVRYKEVEV